MQNIAIFRFCSILKFAFIQNLQYSGQSTANIVVRQYRYKVLQYLDFAIF